MRRVVRVADRVARGVEIGCEELGRVGGLAGAEARGRGHLRRQLGADGRVRVEVVLDGRVHSLEPAILNHGLQLAGVEQLGLFQQARDEDGRGLLHALLDIGDHGEVAGDLNVLLQVEAVGGGLAAELAGFGVDLAGLGALDLVLDAQVDAGGGVGVGLQAPGHVVEDALEADLAAAHPAHAGDVLDALVDLVPDGEELVGGGVFGGGDGVVADDERVQLDDLAVRVQHVDGELARDARGEGRDDGVVRLLGHFFWCFFLSLSL